MSERSAERMRIEDTEEAIDDLVKAIPDSPRSDDRRIHAVYRDVQILSDFTNWSTDEKKVGQRIAGMLLSSKQYADSFSELKPIIASFRGCLRAVADAGPDEHVIAPLCAKLAEIAAELRRSLKRTVHVFTEIIEAAKYNSDDEHAHRQRALRVAYETGIELANRGHYIDAEAQRERLQEEIEETRAASGAILSGSLGSHYQTYAKKEGRSAEVLRSGSVIVLLFVAGVAIHYVLTAEHLTFEAQLIKLCASIPLLLLAGYLARESSRHRSSARWSNELGIALHTLPKYTDRLTEQDRSACRRALGMRIVNTREHTGSKSTNDDSEPQVIPNELSEVVDAVERKIQVVLDTKLPGTRSGGDD